MEDLHYVAFLEGGHELHLLLLVVLPHSTRRVRGGHSSLQASTVSSECAAPQRAYLPGTLLLEGRHLVARRAGAALHRLVHSRLEWLSIEEDPLREGRLRAAVLQPILEVDVVHAAVRGGEVSRLVVAVVVVPRQLLARLFPQINGERAADGPLRVRSRHGCLL